MSRYIAVNHVPCTGCRTCEMVCSLYHFGECHPQKSAISVIRREKDGLVFCLPLVCQQCAEAPCIEACPAGALSRDEVTGVLAAKQDECTACGLCADACPAGCISIDTDRMSVIACDLCGGQPQCVPACHAHCLAVVDRDRAGEKQGVACLVEVLEQEHLQDRISGKRVQ